MQVDEREWASMKAELAKLRGLVGTLMDAMLAIKNESEEMLEAIREKVVDKPMPGEPSSN